MEPMQSQVSEAMYDQFHMHEAVRRLISATPVDAVAVGFRLCVLTVRGSLVCTVPKETWVPRATAVG